MNYAALKNLHFSEPRTPLKNIVLDFSVYRRLLFSSKEGETFAETIDRVLDSAVKEVRA